MKEAKKSVRPTRQRTLAIWCGPSTRVRHQTSWKHTLRQTRLNNTRRGENGKKISVDYREKGKKFTEQAVGIHPPILSRGSADRFSDLKSAYTHTKTSPSVTNVRGDYVKKGPGQAIRSKKLHNHQPIQPSPIQGGPSPELRCKHVKKNSC